MDSSLASVPILSTSALLSFLPSLLGAGGLPLDSSPGDRILARFCFTSPTHCLPDTLPFLSLYWTSPMSITYCPAEKKVKVKVKMVIAQLCLTLCDPMDCSLPGSSVHEILQARILEWVAITPPPGVLPDPGIEPTSLRSPELAHGFFTTSTTWEAPSCCCRCHENF